MVILIGMKTAVSIPDSVFDEAETAAKRLGISRSKLYASAVKDYLKAHTHDRTTEKLNAVYEKESSKLHSFISEMQTASLEPEMW